MHAGGDAATAARVQGPQGIGSDSGETKRQALEDINETLEDVNVFLYSPVIESGVDARSRSRRSTAC